jgi:hypothetical protein
MTASGLEYFVDVMVEVSLQERDGEIVRVFQVVKSNSSAFEVGFEIVGDATFTHFLEHLKRETEAELPLETARPLEVPATLEAKPSLAVVPPQMILHELLEKAARHGFKQADIVTAARVYHNQPNITRLTPDQIADLDRRMSARIEKRQPAEPAASADAAKPRSLKRA